MPRNSPSSCLLNPCVLYTHSSPLPSDVQRHPDSFLILGPSDIQTPSRTWPRTAERMPSLATPITLTEAALWLPRAFTGSFLTDTSFSTEAAEFLQAKPLHHPSAQIILREQPLPPHAQKSPAPALMVFYCRLEIPTVFNEGPTSLFSTRSHRLCSWSYLYTCVIMMGDLERPFSHFWEWASFPTMKTHCFGDKAKKKKKKVHFLCFYEIQFYVSSWVIT